MTDNLYIGANARDGIIRGIKRCAEAVGGTMGSGGHNAVIEVMENPGQMTTNDGATILEAIRFVDPMEEMGRKILLEAVKRANKQSGDGSSTTTVLTAAIIEEGMRHLGDANPMEIKRSLEACIPLIEEAVLAQKREITVDDVATVATISAEDEKIGALIQEIYQQIGAEGIIHWDISKTFEDHYTIGKGITVDGAAMVSPYMADLDEKTGVFSQTAKWKNAHVLITKQKITSAADFNKLFEALFNKDIKEIVVFCDEYEANVVADFIRTRAVRGFKTLLIKMPTLWKDWWYVDLAKATGATVIDPQAGITFKNVAFEHLGKVENITVTKEDTYIDGIKDVSDHVKMLEEEGSDEGALRASRLNTKTARYFVGAASDSALSYKRLKVEDAISAGWQALQNGVVAGGGIALYNAGLSLNPTETVGKNILNTALSAPMKQIYKNASIETEQYRTAFSNDGFDTRTGKQVDMFEAGIIDPANVVINSARNAISVAASVLTASVVIQLPREEPKQ